jgi:hypothetical protein
MKQLDEMTLGHRVMLTVAIVVIIVIVLALFGYLSGRWDDAQAQPLLSSKWDGRLVELDKQALEQAYLDQMGHIFSVWLKHGVDDPKHARVGFNNARKGYNAAMIEIEKREQQ